MMNLIVIDCRPSRRDAIANFLKTLWVSGSRVQVAAFSWTSEVSQDQWRKGLDCLFLHVGAVEQPDAWEMLTTACEEVCAVCYSGGLEIEDFARKHELANPKHIWYGRISSMSATLANRIGEDFSRFLNALSAGPSHLESAARALKCKDWVLEAKLEILHAALKGAQAKDLMLTEGWDLVADFDSEHGSQLRELADAGDLTRLRDYLLPEHEFNDH
jgi:hypothetical protein